MFFIRVIPGTGLFADKGKIDFAVSAAFCDKIIAVTDIAGKERENIGFVFLYISCQRIFLSDSQRVFIFIQNLNTGTF